MKWAAMVGRLCTHRGGVYRIIEWGGRGGHGFYLEALSSNCHAPWLDISEAAIDRTVFGDWTPRFWRVQKLWLIANPDQARTLHDFDIWCDYVPGLRNLKNAVRFDGPHAS